MSVYLLKSATIRTILGIPVCYCLEKVILRLYRCKIGGKKVFSDLNRWLQANQQQEKLCLRRYTEEYTKKVKAELVFLLSGYIYHL